MNKNIWFTSDTHFDHNNIIRLADRPFNDVEEMNEYLILTFNEYVSKNAVVYHLGDFFWGNNVEKFHKIFKRLNGEIHFLIGNHDRKSIIETKDTFASVSMYLEKKIVNYKFVLFHYPIESWQGRYRRYIHLHGHIHKGSFRDEIRELPNRFNVGIDNNDYRPIHIDEILCKVK